MPKFLSLPCTHSPPPSRLWDQEAGVWEPRVEPGVSVQKRVSCARKGARATWQNEGGISLDEQGFGLSVHCQSFNFIQADQSNGSTSNSRHLAWLTHIIINYFSLSPFWSDPTLFLQYAYFHTLIHIIHLMVILIWKTDYWISLKKLIFLIVIKSMLIVHSVRDSSSFECEIGQSQDCFLVSVLLDIKLSQRGKVYAWLFDWH